MNRRTPPRRALGLGLAAALLAAAPLVASDHGDAPAIRFDGRVDINDVYLFTSPSNADNTVMILTTSPVAGVLSPDSFRPGARHQFLVDTDFDAKADARFNMRFGKPKNDGTQKVNVRGLGPALKGLKAKGLVGETLDLGDGVSFTAGLFDDPFFFDLVAFQSGLAFEVEGQDFFENQNTLGIVIELPTARLESPVIGVWAETRAGKLRDRAGRPAINTVLIPSDQKDAFNTGAPADDVKDFRATMIEMLLALGNDQAYSEALTSVLLPDILTIDTQAPTAFPNGRRLDDDAIDVALGLVTNGGLTSDGVDANDQPFSDAFPYLAPAN